MNVKLYVWQRSTAALMAPMVLIHMAVMFYATRRQLTASDILGRTHGSVAWGLFYGTFVIAAAIHASIGLRNIVLEWSPIGERSAAVASSAFGCLLIGLGLRAVFAVVFG